MVMNNGHTIPMVGFGTWQLGNDSVVRSAVANAIKAGYKLIDTAYLYGNEKAIGDTLKDMIQRGLIKREDIFLTTKVWPTHFIKSKVLKSIRRSLKRLQVSQLDLVLLHFPTAFQEGKQLWPRFPENNSLIPHSWQNDSYLEAWRGMEEAVRLGLTRSIGVSNFNAAQVRTLLRAASIKPVVNQVQANDDIQ